jgi:hypothetical protein
LLITGTSFAMKFDTCSVAPVGTEAHFDFSHRGWVKGANLHPAALVDISCVPNRSTALRPATWFVHQSLPATSRVTTWPGSLFVLLDLSTCNSPPTSFKASPTNTAGSFNEVTAMVTHSKHIQERKARTAACYPSPA